MPSAMKAAQEAATRLRLQFARHGIPLSVTIDIAATMTGTPTIRIDGTDTEPAIVGVQKLAEVLASAPAA